MAVDQHHHHHPQTQQFLSSVLSQRGPTALPYAEPDKWLIRQHLLSLTSAYPSLIPKTSIFTHNDGRSLTLLLADGTLPVPFNGVVYNIPILIWLLDSYPKTAPAVYLNPTRDMSIKRDHSHVDNEGRVKIPYVVNWVYPTSNLLDLAKNLIHLFSRDPPLYSRRRNPNLIPNPNNPNNPTNPNPRVDGRYDYSGSVSSGSYPASPYTGGGGGGGGGGVGGGTSTARVRMDDPNEVYKRNAVNKIVDMAHGDLGVMRREREDELDGLFNAQAVLREREREIRKGVEELMDEKEGLEQQLQMVAVGSDVLEGWIRENGSKIGRIGDGGSDDVDGVFEPCDSLSKQMLECIASDLAIEDVIYALDKALQEGALPFDQYLRNVRLLSREQFIHRATSAKVRAAQTQAHVAAMAARASQYVT